MLKDKRIRLSSLGIFLERNASRLVEMVNRVVEEDDIETISIGKVEQRRRKEANSVSQLQCVPELRKRRRHTGTRSFRLGFQANDLSGSHARSIETKDAHSSPDVEHTGILETDPLKEIIQVELEVFSR